MFTMTQHALHITDALADLAQQRARNAGDETTEATQQALLQAAWWCINAARTCSTERIAALYDMARAAQCLSNAQVDQANRF